MIRRYLSEFIEKDLQEKMVFLGGPRQIGKTSLALDLLQGNEEHPAYLNWDSPPVRSRLMKGLLPSDQALIVLDEIHKYRQWRNLVKGFYDTRKSGTSFLITGSARLDYYRRGGDSLQGRYHYYRLHPLSLKELTGESDVRKLLDRLLQFGGFPEPFIKADLTFWKRWQRERVSRVLYEDLQSLELVKEVSSLDLLASILPERVGSPLSIRNLKEDLSVAHETVDRWLTILDNLYYSFQILPFTHKKLRAVRKERKLYLWDWSLCADSGSRIENFVASQLLRYCHFYEDTEGDQMDLRYIRDKEKREMDFIVLKNKKPIFAVECKTGERKLARHIPYFSERLGIPIFQVHIGTDDEHIAKYNTRIIPITTFCLAILL